MFKNFNVFYGYPGGSGSWFCSARGEDEARHKWSQTIGKGKAGFYVIRVELR